MLDPELGAGQPAWIISIAPTAFGGLAPGVVTLVLTLFLIVSIRRSARDGRSTHERLPNAENCSAKRDVLLAGAAEFSPDGKCLLLGLIAASQL